MQATVGKAFVARSTRHCAYVLIVLVMYSQPW